MHGIDPRFGFADWEAMIPGVFRIERQAKGELRFERTWPSARLR
jgi:hypothetical protein